MSWMQRTAITLLFAFIAAQGSERTNEWMGGVQPEDRPFLEFFLRSLVFKDHFGYVLFAEKPMGFFACGKIELVFEQCLIELLDHKQSTLRKGLEIFDRTYSKSPIGKNFIVLKTEDKRREMVFLINRKAFLKTVSQHLREFKKILGNDITGEVLLSKMVREKDVLRCLNHHEGLFGILLGYGKNNAFLFHRRKELHKKTIIPFSAERIDEKLQGIDHSKPSPLRILRLPAFVADVSTQETKLLKKLYREQRKKVALAYQNGDFLQLTLSRLSS